MPLWVTIIEMGQDFGTLPWVLAGEVTESGDYPYDWHERYIAYKTFLAIRIKFETEKEAQKWKQSK